MGRIETFLFAALAVACLCAPAMGVPLLYFGDTSANPLAPIQAGFNESILIAVCVQDVADLSGFQVGITVETGDTTLSLEWGGWNPPDEHPEYAGGGPPYAGAWFTGAVDAALEPHPDWDPKVSVWYRRPWALALMVDASYTGSEIHEPPPPRAAVTGTGDLVVFEVLTGDLAGTATISIDADYTILGDADGHLIAADVSGPITIEISRVPNLLTLEAQDVYVQPGEQFIVNLDVAGLSQDVNACQAFLSYDDSRLSVVSVAAYGAPWDELIFASYTNGTIDLAVGAPAGTNAPGTIAVITFEAKAEALDGTVTLDFRTDGGDTETTMLSDLSAQPVMPQKENSQTIYIDGTEPALAIVSVMQGTTELLNDDTWAVEGTVTVTVTASDGGSGLAAAPALTATDSATNAILVSGPTGGSGTYTFELTIDADTATCTAGLLASATDLAGNIGTATADFEVDVTDPSISIVSIQQDGKDLMAGGFAMEGSVMVVVDAGDAKSGLAAAPVLTAADSATGAITVSGPTGGPGTYTYELTIGGSTANGAATVDVSVSDNAGNAGSTSGTFGVDVTDPSISITSASQGGAELIGVSVNALQGTVTIEVVASDALSLLDGQPDVTVTPQGGTAEDAGFMSKVGDTFTYMWMVTDTTPNGTAIIDASVSDNAGNSSSDAASFDVNKNQIAVSIELEGLAPESGGIVRSIAFVATNTAGDVLMTWNENVLFTTSTVDLCTLTDVPQATVALSAKTDWNLRRKITGLDMDAEDGQETADFTGDNKKLLGGDINGTNGISILDYSLLKIHWFTYDPVADINGDGLVNITDYNIMQVNWFKVGDDE